MWRSLGSAWAVGLMTLSLYFHSAHAATVKQVKGKDVLVELEGMVVQVGDVLTIKTSQGKTTGLVKVSKVQGGRAIARLQKGKAAVGQAVAGGQLPQALSSKTSRGSAKARPSSQPTPVVAYSPPRTYARAGFGGFLGYALGSVTANVGASPVEMSGGAASVKGIFDYELFPQVWFRGMAGMESLAATGPVTAGCQAKACSVTIDYLAADFWGRYVFSTRSFRPWVGAGFSLMFPMSKEATAIQASSITTTSLLSLGLGFDYHFGRSYLPFAVEYGMFPKSETVEASLIAIRLGIGRSF